MKKFLYLIIFLFCINIALASNYEVHRPDNFSANRLDSADEKILFILDFSGSMNDTLLGRKKVDLMLETMSQFLPGINKNTWVGLRVYGHRYGFTAYDSCKASTLLVPITQGGSTDIESKLFRTKARGMTPITYSLKQAVESDFAGFSGKKHIILLTDGGENCDESPCLWAMELIKYRKDVKIDVIAFNIENKDDLEQLECTALVTSGKFHMANTSAELIKGFKESLNIRKDVDAKIIPNK